MGNLIWILDLDVWFFSFFFFIPHSRKNPILKKSEIEAVDFKTWPYIFTDCTCVHRYTSHQILINFKYLWTNWVPKLWNRVLGPTVVYNKYRDSSIAAVRGISDSTKHFCAAKCHLLYFLLLRHLKVSVKQNSDEPTQLSGLGYYTTECL